MGSGDSPLKYIHIIKILLEILKPSPSSWVPQHCLLSVSMKEIYFYIVLYPAALLNFLCLHSFSVISLEFSMYIIVSLRNNNTFTSLSIDVYSFGFYFSVDFLEQC